MQIINTNYASGWYTAAARADGAGNVLLLTEFDMFRARLKKISPARSDLWNIDRINADLPISQIASGGHLGMTVDAAGNTWISGTLQPSDRPSNAFFMKYDKNGGAPRASTFGMKIPAPPGGTAQGVAVATDSAGNRVFVGRFNGTVDFGSGFVTSRGSGYSQQDIFLLRFAP